MDDELWRAANGGDLARVNVSRPNAVVAGRGSRWRAVHYRLWSDQAHLVPIPSSAGPRPTQRRQAPRTPCIQRPVRPSQPSYRIAPFGGGSRSSPRPLAWRRRRYASMPGTLSATPINSRATTPDQPTPRSGFVYPMLPGYPFGAHPLASTPWAGMDTPPSTWRLGTAITRSSKRSPLLALPRTAPS
jgi:hypothetical protein